jgi:TPR repeat protein
LNEQGVLEGSDDKQAAAYYRKACAKNPRLGCFELAELLKSGRVTPRDGEINSLYSMACEHGHLDACQLKGTGG